MLNIISNSEANSGVAVS